MTLTALVLLVVAAATHAGWNLLGKRHHPSVGFFLAAIVCAFLWLVPVSHRWWSAVPAISPRVWLLLALTSACQAFYFINLAGAYRHGHMSIAYPVVRSLPALAVLAVTHLIGQGRPVTAVAIVGIVVVVGGGFVLPMRRLGELRLKNYLHLSGLFAVLAGVGITGFTVIDYAALKMLRETPGLDVPPMGIAIIYFQLLQLGSIVLLGLYVLLSSRERRAVRDVVAGKRLVLVITGLGLAATYTLVLTAMGLATNVSYVYAFVQLSIPLGALAGVLILKEPPHVAKFIGVAMIFAGLILVALGSAAKDPPSRPPEEITSTVAPAEAPPPVR
jgi:drug/metabolite transporter (DMT)-like permease